MVAKWRQVRSREGRMPIGSFAEPESFNFARFYKGLALTVRLDFFWQARLLRNARISNGFEGNRGWIFFWQGIS